MASNLLIRSTFSMASNLLNRSTFSIASNLLKPLRRREFATASLSALKSMFPPAPRGLPQIEVTFDIDANGSAIVSAKDTTTGKEKQIRTRSPDELSESESEMESEAEIHAQKDQERKALIDIKNNADTTVYSVERSLSEYKDKIPVDLVTEIETAVANLMKVSAGDDVDEINSMIRVANRAVSKIGVHMSGVDYRNYDPEPPTDEEDYDSETLTDENFRG